MSTLEMNKTPEGFDPNKDLPDGFLEFLDKLHKKFTPWRNELIKKRALVLEESLKGNLPDYPAASDATKGDWNIKIPDWVKDQRNQMTGPADDAEMVVKMLNSGAPGVMLDLEDSMANSWDNLTLGFSNIQDALYGALTYFDSKRKSEVGIKDENTVIFTRARGLHLGQLGIIRNEVIPASLFDVALVSYLIDEEKLIHPLSFYIPKSESAEEALWWDSLFKEIAQYKGWAPDTIKCMALVEAHPMAFQIEEFIYNLKDHIIGLNLGRWDYMASLIHFNLQDPNWVLPDRNTIPHDVPFFQNVRTLIPDICHKRGILAIVGMTAFFPNRKDSQANTRALEILKEDKCNEASCLMDGAWTGHPDQNEIALDQFPFPNQIDKRLESLGSNPDLRPSLNKDSRHTLEGTRAAIRTVILYRFGYLNGKGASLINGYMEDLATDRIYRLMIAQRIRHYDVVPVFDEQGKQVIHTQTFISSLFDEELQNLINELADNDFKNIEKLKQAREISEEMIHKGHFDPI